MWQNALMVTTGKSSMALAPILLTTLNKHCWCASYKGGAQSKYSFSCNISLTYQFLRCTAPPNNLNQMEGIRCQFQEHTELLVHEVELSLLWDGWGIVSDVVVRILLCILVPIVTFYFLSSRIVLQFTLVHSAYYHPNVINHHFWHHFLQPFMNDFPCADINKLISPDLLHQVIKGSFKDHLVTWVSALSCSEARVEAESLVLAQTDVAGLVSL